MKATANARTIKEYFEGRESKAYQDTGGVWTIGVGHTGSEVVEGLVWSNEKIDDVFSQDSVKFEASVDRLVNVTLNQYQFDALVCLVFNIGSEAFRKSTLLRKLNAGDHNGAANEFPRWCWDNGKKYLGLYRRRVAEKILFGGESAEAAIRIASQINRIPV